MGVARVEIGSELLNQHNVPNYSFPERAACALKAM
jgi:acyl-CoA synthetase (NDP forming)